DGWTRGVLPPWGRIRAMSGSGSGWGSGLPVRRLRVEAGEAGTEDLRLGGFEDVDEDPRPLESLAGGGDVPELLEDEPVERAVFRVGQLHAERLVEEADVRAGVALHHGVRHAPDLLLLDVHLVADLADELLQDVLERHEPV